MKIFLPVTITSLIIFGSFISLPARAEEAKKINICHKDSLLNVSENALAGHLKHNDALPGDPVPGEPGLIYDENCLPVADCPENPLEPGTYERSLVWEGKERWYEIHVPESVSSEPAPLVFNLHPFVLGGNALFRSIWRRESGLVATSEANGFVLVQPDGTGSITAWNGGKDCCGEPAADDVDDVGFIQALATAVGEEICINRSRIYATGMSNGGYLSHRLACDVPNFIAAVAPVVGSLSRELNCTVERGVPVLQITGSEDGLASRTESVKRWVAQNGCTDETISETVGGEEGDPGSVTCTTWTNCNDGVQVEHCIVAKGGHCWFSDLDPQLTPGCPPNENLNSQDKAWEFMSKYSLPPQ